VHLLKNQNVKWFTDNQAVETIVHKGSEKQELQDVAFSRFHLCISNSVHLDMEWIPRKENDQSDYLSKIVDYDDWGLSWYILNLIQRRFGKNDVDWFASSHNAEADAFYSRFLNPCYVGVDAFVENWDTHFGLFVPPICLLSRILKKMVRDRVCGVLVVPC